MLLTNERKKALAAAVPYLVLLGATAALLVASLRLTFERMQIPFEYRVDTLWYLMHFQTIQETGWYTVSLRAGAPEGMQIHDFPMADGLHFVLIKALIALFRDYVTGLNVYLLLTFLLTSTIAFAVLRQMKVHTGVAFVAALLYSFQPYHFRQNIEHIFLSGYYLVPAFVLMVLAVASGRAALLAPQGAGWSFTPHRRALFLWALLCVAIGSSGVYYAFFSVFFLIVTALLQLLHGRKQAAVNAAFLAAIITASMLLNFAPSWAFWAANGPNPDAVSRNSVYTSMFSLNLSQMIAPSDDHGIAIFAKIRHELAAHLGAGKHMEYGGLLAVVGLGILLLNLVKPDLESERGKELSHLSILLLAGLLFAMTGGFGSLFSIVISAKVRALERISIFLAFFCTTAWAVVLSSLIANWSTTVRGRLLAGGLLILLCGFGLADQISKFFVPRYAAIAAMRDNDRELVQRMERVLPTGAMVFQLPYCDFPEPEGCTTNRMEPYDHFRPLLVSRHLRWSHGAVKGRAGARWLKAVAEKKPNDFLASVRSRGFQGVYVDLGGYSDDGAAIFGELRRAIPTKALLSRDGRFAFFDIR